VCVCVCVFYTECLQNSNITIIRYKCLEFHGTTGVNNKYIFVVLQALPGTTLPCNWTVFITIYLPICQFFCQFAI